MPGPAEATKPAFDLQAASSAGIQAVNAPDGSRASPTQPAGDQNSVPAAPTQVASTSTPPRAQSDSTEGEPPPGSEQLANNASAPDSVDTAATPEAGATPPKGNSRAPAAVTPSESPHLTTAQIVARYEPSVALIKGKASSGTGFVVKPGIIATNAHVVEGEFINNLEVRFPSARAEQQGPLAAELLYEDTKRDLAFLAVESDLDPVEVAPSYKFIKGDDITVIGNPGLGDEIVLENAISRGVISSKTVIDGANYIQLGVAVNPGNSGGPVFDSTGRVIGVVTLKSTKAESVAFCIPVEDLQAALATVDSPNPAVASRHRARLAFKLLTTGGALYAIGLDVRSTLLQNAAAANANVNLLPNDDIRKLDELLTNLDQKLFALVDPEMRRLRTDLALGRGTQSRFQELATNYKSMKSLYAGARQPADRYASQAEKLRARHLQIVQALKNDLKLEVPSNLLALLQQPTTSAQPPTIVMQIVPSHIQSRLLRGRLVQRGPLNQVGPEVVSPAQTARERMQNLRNRARNLRSRLNP
jgi:serine protease Do